MLVVMVAGRGKQDAEAEAKAVRAAILKESRSPSSPAFVRIGEPQDLYDPEHGRGLFPNFFGP